ncbi:hypothetical protein [Sorangium sp. So ce1151]|uniref:hypothetical protein n=1 Tax=Sorangium sp. So ce1151 TaxID=3133332 RepID=UPI003F60E1AC
MSLGLAWRCFRAGASEKKIDDHERFRGPGESAVALLAVQESTRGLLSTVSISPAERPIELLDPGRLAGGASLHA